MKELKFSYSMNLEFDRPIKEHRFTIKCTPESDERQKISNLNVDIYPKEFLSRSRDSFGNVCIYGYSEGEHNHFSINVSGDAKCGLSDYESSDNIYHVGMYKYQSKYTKPGPTLIRAYENDLAGLEKEPELERAVDFMKYIYGSFQYVQGVTGVATTAEEAFAGGQGVCQDYSHILISFCRMSNIPARYVVGMLIGEGLSHAWVEIFSGGKWIALDPTNNLLVSDEHIKISAGRDYGDCAINQGMFTGQANQSQEVSVKVEEKRRCSEASSKESTSK